MGSWYCIPTPPGPPITRQIPYSPTPIPTSTRHDSTKIIVLHVQCDTVYVIVARATGLKSKKNTH